MSKMKRTSKISQGGVIGQAKTGVEGQTDLTTFIEKLKKCTDDEHVFAIFCNSEDHNLIMNNGDETCIDNFVVEFVKSFLNDGRYFNQFKAHVELLNIIVKNVDAHSGQSNGIEDSMIPLSVIYGKEVKDGL